MRPSCYLNAVEIGDGNAILYNGFSMCIDIVPSVIAHALVSAKEGTDLSSLLPAEKEHLAKRGHLTTLSVEREQAAMLELARALAKRGVERTSQPLCVRMLTFILTYTCNLSCSYCFQSRVRQTAGPVSMNGTFVDDFLQNHLVKLFPDTPRNKFRFILFGGEPLLPGNRGTIERILRYAEEHGVVVSAATNAIMLPKMLDLVGPENGKIKNVQVTLDGGRMFHDKTRVSRSGDPTFDDIIGSVWEVVKLKARAIIRIHLHPNRMESAQNLVRYLDREQLLGNDRVEIYFAPVHSFHAQDISSSDFDLFCRVFQYVAMKQKTPPIQNFDFLGQIMDTQAVRDWSQPRYCAVSSGLHYAVDPLGDIYECLEEAGHKDRRIGTLSRGKIEFFELRNIYRESSLANMPECLKCSIALFCGGGCISKTRTQGGSVFKQFCTQNKVFVGQTLKACFLMKQSGNIGA